MHEFEALVLSKPEVFGDLFENAERHLIKLVDECQLFDTPEKINQGQHTHPKARIKKHFEDYHENVDGPVLINDIGLSIVREKCPHFNQWLTKLEEMNS